MDISGKVVFVTGGAKGIGAALAQAAAARGAKAVGVVDLDGECATQVAHALPVPATGLGVDMRDEAAVAAALTTVQDKFGPIDLVCSNAGIGFSDAPGWQSTSQTNDQWQAVWEVNVMAHIYLARALLPAMIDRGSGYFLITASAAGLLNQIGDAVYATTKHAAIGFAENLAITHGDDGIGVSALCPQAVDTDMIKMARDGAASVDGILSPDVVAQAAMDGVEAGTFLITPHAQVRDYMRHKVTDYDRWLGGMRKFRRMLKAQTGQPI